MIAVDSNCPRSGFIALVPSWYLFSQPEISVQACTCTHAGSVLGFPFSSTGTSRSETEELTTVIAPVLVIPCERRRVMFPTCPDRVYLFNGVSADFHQ